MRFNSQKDIVAFLLIASLMVVFIIGNVVGGCLTKFRMEECKDPVQVIEMEGTKTQFYVYQCGGKEYKTYDRRLPHAKLPGSEISIEGGS